MKKAIFITLLFPLLIKAQINSEQEVSLIDTVYYDYRHGMFKTACFVEKYTRLNAQIWAREIYTMEGDLLAKGNIQLVRKRFKKPVQGNFVLIDKWVYYDEYGLIRKERDYQENMEFPETIEKEVSPNRHLTIW
jgi:hypothetical protein